MIFVIYLLTNVITYQFSHAGTCAYRADARHESFDGQWPFAQPIQWNPSNDEWHG